MKQTAEVSVWEATDIARQICSAIDHARLRHLGHRNLTPTNIMVEWDGTIKVMDYETLTDPGESYHAGRNPEALHYLSPEQATGGEPDWRSNLFSLGAMLYELLTGEKAFPGADAREILEGITSREPKAPRLVKATLNSGLSLVIMKALSKTPAERYQSGAELIHDFENCRKPIAQPTPPAAKPANSVRNLEERPNPSPLIVSNMVKQPAAVAPRPEVSIGIRPAQSFPPPSKSPQRARLAGDSEYAKSAVTVDPAISTAIASVPFTMRDDTLETMAARPEFEEPAVEDLRKAVDVAKPRAKAKPSLSTSAAKQSLSTFAVKHKTALLYVIAGVLLLVASFGLGRGIGDVIRAYVRPSPSAAPAAEQPQPQPQPQTMPVAAAAEEVAPARDETPAARSGRRTGKRRSAPVIVAAAPALMAGELIIDSSPQGATIQLDGGGTLSLQTPYTATSLSVGRHTVGVSKPGYATESRTIEIAAGQKSHLMIALTELGATVSFASDPPGAAVFIDGQDSGKTTPAALVLRKGSHTLTLRKAGYLQASAKMELTPGQSFQFAPHLLPTGNEDDIKAVGKLGRMLGRHSRSSMATLQIRTNPKGARIIVNQRLLEKTTPAEFSVPEGAYEIGLALDGYSRVERTISVVAGSTFVIDEKLQK
jgi:hypothetical protein